jgi:hypothetical protein
MTEEKKLVLTPYTLSKNTSVTKIHDTGDIPGKIKNIKLILKDCLARAEKHKKAYKKKKRRSDIIDGINTGLSASSIACLIVGLEFPPVLIPSAILSGLNFIISRVSERYNLPQQYSQHNLTSRQYSDLAREIRIVLSKNHMSSQDYQNYLEEIGDKISLISDSELY